MKQLRHGTWAREWLYSYLPWSLVVVPVYAVIAWLSDGKCPSPGFLALVTLSCLLGSAVGLRIAWNIGKRPAK
jgi:hypothetical protein